MHINTQSMTSTFAELSLLVNDYQFDIGGMSETWLKDNSLLLQHVSIPGHELSYTNAINVEVVALGHTLKKASNSNEDTILKNYSQILNIYSWK